MFDIAIIVPCYNEASRIKHTFDAYFNYFSKNNFFDNKKITIILVDDGSTDETIRIIEELKVFSNNKITVNTVSYQSNQGKGAAIKRGCEMVEAEIYGFVDADLSFQPELITEALPYFDQYDLVIGQRSQNKMTAGYSKLRNIISKLLYKIGNLFFSLPNLDTQCGFKLFNNKIAKNILPQIKQNRFAFDLKLILLSQSADYKIKPLSINFTHSKKSSIIWKDGIRYILDTISLSERLKISRLKQIILPIFLVSAIISTVMYGWVVFNGFFFSDDFTWLWYGERINNSLEQILHLRMSTFYSPVINTFYSVMYSVFHYHPAPYFLAGIMVHILASVLFGVLVWQLSQSRLIAFTSVFLASFAGNAYEPLVWVGANMHSFVTLFILASLVFYYHYLTVKKPGYLIPAFLFFVSAIGTKESAIITPIFLILLSIYYRLEQKNFTFSKSLYLFWSAIAFVSSLYVYEQYLWQKNGIWVQTGAWGIHIISFLKIPLVILDNFIPISFLQQHLTTLSAGFLCLLTILFIFFILYKFKRLKLIWLGFLWLLISLSPFIFFKTEFWWETLASRYNYMPRLGAIVIIAVILQYLIVYNKSRYIINGLIYFVIITTTAQIYFATMKITSEYNYVYNTGRSLVQVMKQIDAIDPEKLIVAEDHPFPGNTAHIVGAASIIANMAESDIIFLQKDESLSIENRNVLLYWNHQSRKYEIK